MNWTIILWSTVSDSLTGRIGTVDIFGVDVVDEVVVDVVDGIDVVGVVVVRITVLLFASKGSRKRFERRTMCFPALSIRNDKDEDVGVVVVIDDVVEKEK